MVRFKKNLIMAYSAERSRSGKSEKTVTYDVIAIA